MNASVDINPAMTVLTDFSNPSTSVAPASGADGIVPLWNVTSWDEAYWDGGAPVIVTSGWQSIGKSGFVIAPELSLTFDIDVTPVVELMAMDATFLAGAIVS